MKGQAGKVPFIKTGSKGNMETPGVGEYNINI